jgi:hypothetical protein
VCRVHAVVIPGVTTRLTASLAVADYVTSLVADLRTPAGWTARPVSPAPTSLASGQVATATWEVTAPAGLSGGDPRVLMVTAQATARGRSVTASGECTPSIVPVMSGHLLDQDFESLADKLRTADQRPAPAGMLGWTAAAPAGWSVANAPAMPQGPRDLQGWTFMTKRMVAQGGQDRDLFTRGLGILAIADPDDWDDLDGAAGRGRFDSTLVSPAVPIPSGTAKLHLAFDSHYRQEAPQKATVTATFDAGEPLRLLYYSGDTTGNDNAGKDVENTSVSKEIAVPPGATAVTLRWRLFDAGNNWYWAIDHIRLDDSPISGE